jgi:hypothetical protein
LPRGVRIAGLTLATLCLPILAWNLIGPTGRTAESIREHHAPSVEEEWSFESREDLIIWLKREGIELREFTGTARILFGESKRPLNLEVVDGLIEDIDYPGTVVRPQGVVRRLVGRWINSIANSPEHSAVKIVSFRENRVVPSGPFNGKMSYMEIPLPIPIFTVQLDVDLRDGRVVRFKRYIKGHFS